MVDFNKTLSPVDTRAASYVSPEIVDNSAAIGIQNNTRLLEGAAKIGTAIYNQDKVNDLNEADQKAISDYMAQHRVNDETQNLDILTARQQDIFRSGEDSPGDLSTIQKAQIATYQRLMNAKAQGHMSPAEFSDRILTNLREAVNNNPGLQKELTAEAAKVLDLSGITGIIKQDEILAEEKLASQDAFLKDARTRARKADVSYRETEPAWKILSKVEPIEQAKRLAAGQLREQKRFDRMTEAEALNWIDTTGDQVMIGNLQNTSSTILQIIEENQINGTNYTNFSGQIEQVLEASHNAYATSMPAKIRNNDAVKALITQHREGIDAIKDRFSRLGSGEDAAKAMTNELNIIKGTQELAVRGQYDVASLDLINSMIKNAPEIMVNDGDLRKKWLKILESIFNGNIQSPALNDIVPKNIGDQTQAPSFITSSVAIGNKEARWKTFEDVIDTFSLKAVSIDNPVSRSQFIFNNLKTIAQTEFENAPSTSIAAVDDHVSTMFNDPVSGMIPMMKALEGREGTLDLLPNGNIIFQGNQLNEFNSKFGTRINIALKAYANVRGISTKEAVKDFYPTYMPQLFNDDGGDAYGNG